MGKKPNKSNPDPHASARSVMLSKKNKLIRVDSIDITNNITIHDDTLFPGLKSDNEDEYLSACVEKSKMEEQIRADEVKELNSLEWLGCTREYPVITESEIKEHLRVIKFDGEKNAQFLQSVDVDGELNNLMNSSISTYARDGTEEYSMKGLSIMMVGISSTSHYDLIAARNISFWLVVGEAIATVTTRQCEQNAVIRISTVHKQLYDAMHVAAQYFVQGINRNRHLIDCDDFVITKLTDCTVFGNRISGYKFVIGDKISFVKICYGDPLLLVAYMDRAAIQYLEKTREQYYEKIDKELSEKIRLTKIARRIATGRL